MLPCMLIGRRLKRTIALVLLAALAFAQASVALAACELDRGSLAHAVEEGADCPCVDAASQLTPGCVAHCTADLQLAGAATVIARAPADVPVLFVAPPEPSYAWREWQDAGPPGGLSVRILFQSLLI
jgi:hypothetical protein